MNNFLKNDWKTKILAVAIAIIFWFFVLNVSNPIEDKTIYNVPIELKNESYLNENGYKIKNTLRSSIDITVRGRREALAKITTSNFETSLDYSQIKTVNDKKLIISEPICEQKNITIQSYSPATIDVQLTRDTSRTFDVELKSNITMKPGYVLLSTIMSPDSLPILNEESLIDSIGSIKANLEIKDLDRDTTKQLQCTVYNKEGKEINGLSNDLKVSVKLEVAKEVPVSLVTRGRLATDYIETLRVIDPIKALITGPVETLANISEIKTEQVDIEKITENFTDSVPLVVPEGVKLVNTPINITVNINIEKLVLKDIEVVNEDISILNATNDGSLVYEIKIDKLMLQFKGRQADVNAIKLDNLRPAVDVSGLLEGTHKLPISIATPSQVKLVKQEYVEVKILKTAEPIVTPTTPTTEEL